MKHCQLRPIASDYVSASARAPFVQRGVLELSCGFVALSLVLFLFLIGCGTSRTTVATVSADSAVPQAALFTVPADQLPRLKVVPAETATWMIAVRTTGTVDWDADHTTQAITQVNGPISRILVDTGAVVTARRSAALCLQPRRGQRHLDLQKGAQPQEFAQRTLDPHARTCWTTARSPAKTWKPPRPTYNDACTDVQNSLQALKIFGITQAGDRPGGAAGRAHQHRTGRALAHRRRRGAEAGLAGHGDPGRRHRLLHDQRRLHGLGAGPHLRPRPAVGSRWATRWT